MSKILGDMYINGIDEEDRIGDSPSLGPKKIANKERKVRVSRKIDHVEAGFDV
ncbi:hypothetical protein Csa_004917 [Cucumis sativus]|uniref:Uncharacterized protein n=1 Tax=Cucumis sativus TaxID=3659 RepID=A0A0A0KB95_CUCSA|nr:hypothetical protein Csa_004917 [Cucumis sativus]